MSDKIVGMHSENYHINSFYNTKLVSTEQLNLNSKLYPLGFGEPEYIANLASFLISEESIWITGSSVIADGGFTIQ